jgi:hypothetical protein
MVVAKERRSEGLGCRHRMNQQRDISCHLSSIDGFLTLVPFTLSPEPECVSFSGQALCSWAQLSCLIRIEVGELRLASHRYRRHADPWMTTA